MSSSVNVGSVESLAQLRTALVRFGADTRQTLDAAELEIRRTLDWLADRQRHWQVEVRRRQEVVARARAALAACMMSGDSDHPPDCSAYQAALSRAQMRLREAEGELRKVQKWTRTVQQVVADYQRQAQRLAAILGGDLPRAGALLGRRIADLEAYASLRAPSAEPSPSGGSSAWIASSSGAPTSSYASDRNSAARGGDLAGVALAMIGWLASDIRQTFEAHGDRSAVTALDVPIDLREFPLDPPRHGFDRVFTTPNLPLIVLERSRADDDPDAMDATAGQIAELVRDLALAPLIAIVVLLAAGFADVYSRVTDSDEWRLLRRRVPLDQALEAASAPTSDPQTEEQER